MTDGLPQSRLSLTHSSRLIALLVIAGLFVAAQISINSINGWWLDELFSLWSTNTSLPFREAFTKRIWPDSNPPLYFSALYAARLVIEHDRMAIIALNVAFMLASASAVLLASRKSDMSDAAIVAVAAFVLSGPVLAYSAEGRSYLAALAIVFCASWFAVLAVCRIERWLGVLAFAVLGILAALTHAFSALFCGSLAAGLLGLALVDSSRRDLVVPALVLGLSTSVMFAAWLFLAWDSLGNIGWIKFSFPAIREAIWFVRKLAVGGILAVLLLAALLLIGIARPATRSISIVFGIAFALFVLLPLIASLKQPMINGRYWMIGAPALPVLVVALAAIWHREGRDPRNGRIPLYALGGAVVLALVSGLSGFLTAREFTAGKPVWVGTSVTVSLLKSCPDGSVRVGMYEIANPSSAISPHFFAYMAEAPASLFVDVSKPQTPLQSPADARCPMLAWAEHVQLGNDYPGSIPDVELLRLMKIDASPQDVEVRRHPSGFIILKR
jgi:hypothetical protein